jgi:hypothetical protein
MAKILTIIPLVVGDKVLDFKVEKYTKEQIIVRTTVLGFFPAKFTLDAVKYPQWFPKGFPTSLEGGFPNRVIFTFKVLWREVHITITGSDWKRIISLLIAKGVL